MRVQVQVRVRVRVRPFWLPRAGPAAPESLGTGQPTLEPVSAWTRVSLSDSTSALGVKTVS